jgi:hypothetical protein
VDLGENLEQVLLKSERRSMRLLGKEMTRLPSGKLLISLTPDKITSTSGRRVAPRPGTN